LAATACDDASGIFLYFSTQIGLSLRNCSTFWDSECVHLGGFYFDPRVGTFDRRNVYIEKGRTAVAMPRLPNNPDRDFSASQSEDDINADIAEFFASRPLGIVELFADPIVRMRIGSLIREAMNRPTRLRRRVKFAKPRSAQ
jgi:hypothetical protein